MRGGPIPRTVTQATMRKERAMTTENHNEYNEFIDDALEWLDSSPRGYDAWQIVEEAARLRSLEDALAPFNLHLAGRVYGMACALQVMYDHGTGIGEGFCEGNANEWAAFIEGFAEDNYENGERIC